MRVVIGTLLLGLPLLVECAGGKQTPPSEPTYPADDAGPEADASLEDEGISDASADVVVDEEAALRALVSEMIGRQQAPDASAPHGVRFSIFEQGPDQPWLLVVANDGREPAELVADPRLVELEITVPGKKKPVKCKMPRTQIPDEAEKEFVSQLEPGQVVAHRFDPRLYCFGAAGQDQLVPGAFVAPRLGWAPKTKKRWTKGKVEETPVEPQSPPFVATIGEADAGDAVRIKQLEAPGFSLSSEYQKWSRHGLKRPDDDESPFVLEARRGSDAETIEGATITITLRNRSKKRRHVFFRRELVSFEVAGADSIVSCDAQPDDRAPTRESYANLGPGQSITRTSRLIELCPQGIFARPGLYLLHARFDATLSGGQWGLRAFVGQVVTQEPAAVRIRKGDLPLFTPPPMRVLAMSPTSDQ